MKNLQSTLYDVAKNIESIFALPKI